MSKTSVSDEYTEKNVNGSGDGDEAGGKFTDVINGHSFVCNMWKRLGYFWSQEQRSRDGVWS